MPLSTNYYGPEEKIDAPLPLLENVFDLNLKDVLIMHAMRDW